MKSLRTHQARREEAVQFAWSVLRAAGASPDDARIVAESLVESTGFGIESHGLSRLSVYVERLRQGGIGLDPWELKMAEGPLEHYDGRAGLGHVHFYDAATRAIELCKEHRLAVIGVSNSNHAGALGLRVRLIAQAGLVGFATTNGPPVMMTPGGVRAVIAPNPIAVAAPMPNGPPVVCDFSAGQTSRGSIMVAAQSGKAIPETWAVDSEGRSTTNAEAALRGMVLPLGGPKGFALGLAAELLTGALVGPAVGPDVVDFFDDFDRPQRIAHLLIALDPTFFGSRDAFATRMQRLADAIGAASDEGTTRVPGSRRAMAEAASGHFVPISDSLKEQLEALAQHFQLEPLVTEEE